MSELQRARALADATRAELRRILVSSDKPMRVAELAEMLDVHHTVVRQHMKVLSDAGLVTSERLPVSSRGRPSTGWRGVAIAPESYRQLSTMLVEAVRHGTSPRDQGVVSGRRLGGQGRPGVEAIVTEAAVMGFRPRTRLRGDGRVDVILQECPYADVAEFDPHVVCDLHWGIAEGIAVACGDVVVEGFDVRPPHRAGCRIGLRSIVNAQG